jgi:ABC-type uncharacterized transport system involved in gliding motility auxiliary subunit
MTTNKEQQKRHLSFGIYSGFVTLTVISLVGLVNFLGKQYPAKLDLTKNRIHTFSDQTSKVLQGLKAPVEAVFFGEIASREKYRRIFDNYKKGSTQFKFEWVDPVKEPTRAKSAGIKKIDTLILTYQGKTSKVEEITEEKITNELIKITKDGAITVCAIGGHGEPSFTDSTALGFSAAKKGLEDQSYQVREITLPQETKIPQECSALVMMGASKALFPSEIKMLTEYLDQGGRIAVGVDASVTGRDQSEELRTLLTRYGIEVKNGLMIDPVSKMLGVDASVPMMAQFNRDTAIGKDFTAQAFFPFSRPVDLSNPAPEGLKTAWIAKSTPKAFAETDLAGVAKGSARYDAGRDLAGPLTAAAISYGKLKDSKASRETRLVVFGSGQFANNQYSRFGGNLDLFLNSVSWALEDESMISIRPKDEDDSKIELSQNQGVAIFWICVVLAPLFIAVAGIVIWVRRKKL